MDSHYLDTRDLAQWSATRNTPSNEHLPSDANSAQEAPKMFANLNRGRWLRWDELVTNNPLVPSFKENQWGNLICVCLWSLLPRLKEQRPEREACAGTTSLQIVAEGNFMCPTEGSPWTQGKHLLLGCHERMQLGWGGWGRKAPLCKVCRASRCALR